MPYTINQIMKAMEDPAVNSVNGMVKISDTDYGFSAYKVVGGVVRIDIETEE